MLAVISKKEGMSTFQVQLRLQGNDVCALRGLRLIWVHKKPGLALVFIFVFMCFFLNFYFNPNSNKMSFHVFILFFSPQKKDKATI